MARSSYQLMIAILVLFLAQPTSAIHNVSLQTQTINGSVFFLAENNGNYTPWVWLNKSSGNAQMATTYTDNATEMLESRLWFNFRDGFSRFNGALGQFIGQSDDSLDSFTCAGVSDNSTYWRTDCNGTRNVGGRNFNMTLSDGQRQNDSYVTETWGVKYNTNLTIGFDLYFVQQLANITYLDVVYMKNSSNGTDTIRLSQNKVWDNVTFLGVVNWNDFRGWNYLLDPTKYGNKVVVYNGSVYIGLNLGRNLTIGDSWSLKKIDPAVCSGPGESIAVITLTPYSSNITTGTNTSCVDVGVIVIGSCIHIVQDRLQSTQFRNIPANFANGYTRPQNRGPVNGALTGTGTFSYCFSVGGMQNATALPMQMRASDGGTLFSDVYDINVWDVVPPSNATITTANFTNYTNSNIFVATSGGDAVKLFSLELYSNVSGSWKITDFQNASPITNLNYTFPKNFSVAAANGCYIFGVGSRDTGNNLNMSRNSTFCRNSTSVVAAGAIPSIQYAVPGWRREGVQRDKLIKSSIDPWYYVLLACLGVTLGALLVARKRNEKVSG